MRRNWIFCVISIVIAIYSGILIFLYFHIDSSTFINSDLGVFLSGIFAPISAIGTIIVSYLIYKLSSTEKRADDDFKMIIGIYYKIEETFELMNSLSDTFNDEKHKSIYERKLKVDSLLLLNYIRRIPNKRHNTINIEKALMGIYVNPHYETNYNELADEFQNFCYELNPNWNTCVFKLDNNE